MVQAKSVFEHIGHESDEVLVSEFRAMAPSHGKPAEYAALVKKPHASQCLLQGAKRVRFFYCFDPLSALWYSLLTLVTCDFFSNYREQPMKLSFALLLIVFLAFSGYHLSFRNFRLPYFARQFYLTGIEFIFMGMLLGPQFLNLLDPETLMGLAPLNALVLGWVGLLFGFQFEIRKLRRFPVEFFVGAAVESALTLFLVFIALYVTMIHFFSLPTNWMGGIALTLAAAAGCTSQTGLALLPSGLTGSHPHTVTFLRFISSMGGLIALVFFGLVFLYHPSVAGSPEKGLLPGLGAGVGLVLLFHLILSRRFNEKELILVVIAMAILTSGMASALNFSPLVMNFIVGFWITNLSRDKERIYRILMPMEKPAYLLLLFFLGVYVQFNSLWLLLFASAYCGYRILGKLFAGFLITNLTPELKKYPLQLGYGLLAQGGLAMAILLDFQDAFHSTLSTQVTSVAVLAVIYNEFLSPYFLKQLLKKNPYEHSVS